MNLFCVPFAGGSSYSYKGLAGELHGAVSAVMLELPGRGRRFSEPLLTDARDMADDLYRQMEGMLDEPYGLYGHSLGSLLVFLLSRKIAGLGCPMPSCLFLSGCEAPSAPRRKRHLLPDAEFREELRVFGGCPPEVLNNAELMEIFEPVLRADFKAYETYAYVADGKMDVPMTAMIGDQEEINREEVKRWQDETARELSLHIFTGGHFFIFQHWDSIGRLISLGMAPPLQ